MWSLSAVVFPKAEVTDSHSKLGRGWGRRGERSERMGRKWVNGRTAKGDEQIGRNGK